MTFTMAIIELKEGNLETKLAKLNITETEERQIKAESPHYDEYYYRRESDNFVKGFRQEFIGDPHMALDKIPEVRLIAYNPDTNLQELEGVFQKDTVPIITRVEKGVVLSGFRPIHNREGDKTVLIPIEITIPSDIAYQVVPNIRNMDEIDLPKIEKMFRNQYSLRYRMVNLMWETCPNACFVYEKEGEVIGVTFNRIEGDELYMRQIFVREGHRKKGIGLALYEKNFEFASQCNLKSLRGYIRQETELFHARFYPILGEDKEYYVIRREENAKLNK